MKHFRFLFLALLCSIASINAAYATPQLTDSARISVLTCGPGTAIYELFGHTGIRVYDPGLQMDIVFNYGLFDFNQDDFIIRFVRGKTDYQIGASSYFGFLSEYFDRGSAVYETVLNTNRQETQDLLDYLVWNLQDENKIYRYNFIFNNCATKVRDVVEQTVNNHIIYPTGIESYSFREAVKLYTHNAPWSQFGFDICLGAGMDRIASDYEMMFLPEHLRTAIQNAKRGDLNNLPLTKKDVQLAPQTLTEAKVWFSPLLCGILLCIINLLLSVWSVYKQRSMAIYDSILFVINGLLGCLILFLVLFSKHPFTNDNYNLLWLNPLMFGQLLLYFKVFRHFTIPYYALMSVILTLFFVLSPILPQHFNIAAYAFAAAYLIRTCSYVFEWAYVNKKSRH